MWLDYFKQKAHLEKEAQEDAGATPISELTGSF